MKLDMRVDAEYYSPAYLRCDRNLAKLPSSKLSRISKITDGEHGSPQLDSESNIAYLSGNNIKDNVLVLDDVRYCTELLHKKNKRSALELNSVLLSIVGTVGNASVVYEKIIGNTDRNVASIKKIDSRYSPYFVSTFLNSKYGRYQTERLSTGNVQPLLNLIQVNSIIIPSVSSSFQQRIESLVKEAHHQKQLAEKLYKDAENLLLAELGLLNWKPNTIKFTHGGMEFEVEDSISRVSSVEVLNVERLDAEHFLPKYTEILKRIKSAGFATHFLRQIILPVMNGFDCRDFVEEGTPYIRVGDVKRGRINIDSALQIPITSEQVRKNISLQVGDVLFTRKGSFGNAAPVTCDSEHAVISSEIMLLRINPQFTDSILSEYLALFFNSIAGYLQSEKWAHGVAFYSITQADMGRFVIPVIPLTKQKQLLKIQNKSEAARAKSCQLLEQAKFVVEAFIEYGEKAALALLDG